MGKLAENWGRGFVDRVDASACSLVVIVPSGLGRLVPFRFLLLKFKAQSKTF